MGMKMMEETVELVVKIPKKLAMALNWYLPYTPYWAGEPSRVEAMSALVAGGLREYMGHEAAEPLLALEAIKAELKTQLEA